LIKIFEKLKIFYLISKQEVDLTASCILAKGLCAEDSHRYRSEQDKTRIKQKRIHKRLIRPKSYQFRSNTSLDVSLSKKVSQSQFCSCLQS